MKYLLMIHVNPTLLDALSEEDRQAVFDAHDEFGKITRESGEFVSSIALADPSNSTTVRVRDEAAAVTDGPYVESKEFLAGYYIVDCETVERAQELAALIPDAKFNAIEVRPVMNEAGLEM
ncbi:MAG TPA: YciI family protein [Acidimicrobiales bacterium]|nr:YciI family protein [Acidimicrobiales bacterium]